MTREEAAEAAKVLQHYADGGAVWFRYRHHKETDNWFICDNVQFDWKRCEYRIHREPQSGVATGAKLADVTHSAYIFVPESLAGKKVRWEEVIE